MQSTTGFVVAQLTAIHFQKVTSCLQHLRGQEDSARGFFWGEQAWADDGDGLHSDGPGGIRVANPAE